MNISTKIESIDFNKLIDECLNKKQWGKIYQLFEYDNIVITMELESIDVKENSVRYCIQADDKLIDRQEIRSIDFPMSLEHRNVQVFTNKINSVVFRVLEDLEKYYYLNYTEEYKRLVEHNKNVMHTADQIANNKLDTLNITDEDIREAYVLYCVNKADKKDSYTLKENLRTLVLGNVYSAYSSYSNSVYNKEIVYRVGERDKIIKYRGAKY